MNLEEAIKLLRMYDRTLAQYAPLECLSQRPASATEAYGHVRGMLPRMQQMAVEGQEGKFCRWLGFVQGIFYDRGVFTVDDMREHNTRVFKGSSDESG